jgi:hypothetical protein
MLSTLLLYSVKCQTILLVKRLLELNGLNLLIPAYDSWLAKPVILAILDVNQHLSFLWPVWWFRSFCSDSSSGFVSCWVLVQAVFTHPNNNSWQNLFVRSSYMRPLIRHRKFQSRVLRSCFFQERTQLPSQARLPECSDKHKVILYCNNAITHGGKTGFLPGS